MNPNQPYGLQFTRADANRDGTIDEREFRQFLGPIVRDERRLSADLQQQNFSSLTQGSSSGEIATETITYTVGLDVAVAGFTQNPIEYEKYTSALNANEGHQYGVGPDVGIGAPNVARNSIQYDPAAAMFNYADINRDGKIDQQEFGSFMRSV